MESRQRVVCDPDALETLRVVRDEVLVDDSHWTKNVFARDENGKSVPDFDWQPSKDAVSFCLLGACKRAAYLRTKRKEGMSSPAGYAESWRAEDCLRKNLPRDRKSIPDFNDDPNVDFREVRAFLDFVIGDVSGGTTEAPKEST